MSICVRAAAPVPGVLMPWTPLALPLPVEDAGALVVIPDTDEVGVGVEEVQVLSVSPTAPWMNRCSVWYCPAFSDWIASP